MSVPFHFIEKPPIPKSDRWQKQDKERAAGGAFAPAAFFQQTSDQIMAEDNINAVMAQFP
jgi:hypothetical protein